VFSMSSTTKVIIYHLKITIIAENEETATKLIQRHGNDSTVV
jgi:hypothetical protein